MFVLAKDLFWSISRLLDQKVPDGSDVLVRSVAGHDVQTSFSAFDVDGDGFLNLDEVYQAIHSLGKVWPMKDIREALPKDCKEVDFPGKIFISPQTPNILSI